MTRLLQWSAAFILLFIVSSCAKYDEELDCNHVPVLKTCDVWDVEPDDFLLDLTITTTGTFPLEVEIYNRTLLTGIGNLFVSIESIDSNLTYILPSGRYTAQIEFFDGSIVQKDFRVYASSNEYCEGICYRIHDVEIEIVGP